MSRTILLCVTLACFAPAAGGWPRPPANQAAAPAAQAPPVTRKVKGLTLTSDDTPRVRIKFGRGLKYAGGQSFVLYDVASAEQHFFVDADAEGRVRRLYWVQFEGYLPSNTHKYNYKSPKTVNIGGLDFFADSQARQIPAPDPSAAAKPANKISDGDHARSFLASKGYRLASGEALWQRLVHMTDASNRSELMVIYLEDLSGMGLRAADLNDGGKAAARWEAVSKELLERAQKGMTITRR
ncbi:MAG: hypothetical protein LC795_03930 [Acidobacteria bacterium]|nr:hypothetical protein [Acidobacteriota bacterium]